MGNSDRAVRGVDRLAARPRRPIDVDPQIFVVDLDVDILRFRKNRDGRGRGMDSSAAFGYRNALDAVDSAFELELRENASPADRSDRFLVAAKLGRARAR